MAFVDAYPGGRLTVLAPIEWDGWPVVEEVNGARSSSYPFPVLSSSLPTIKSLTGDDTFAGTILGPEWKWNYNPDDTKWSVNNGLTLQRTGSDRGAAYNCVRHKRRCVC